MKLNNSHHRKIFDLIKDSNFEIYVTNVYFRRTTSEDREFLGETSYDGKYNSVEGFDDYIVSSEAEFHHASLYTADGETNVYEYCLSAHEIYGDGDTDHYFDLMMQIDINKNIVDITFLDPTAEDSDTVFSWTFKYSEIKNKRK